MLLFNPHYADRDSDGAVCYNSSLEVHNHMLAMFCNFYLFERIVDTSLLTDISIDGLAACKGYCGCGKWSDCKRLFLRSNSRGEVRKPKRLK